MATEARSRAVLRPAGNVALPDSSGAHTRKSTKKPPASPPFKPSSPLSVKSSPPNSQPTTPRTSLSKSPALIKHPKLAPVKLSTPSANMKSNAILDPVHTRQHRHGLLHCSPPQRRHTSVACSHIANSIPISDHSALHLSPSLEGSPVIDPGSQHEHVLDLCKHNMPAAAVEPDNKAVAPRRSTSEVPVDARSLTNDLSNLDSGDAVQVNSSHVGISSAKAPTCTESPPPRRKANCRSHLSRSSSDHFQRRSPCYTKGSGSRSIGSHSLDDVTLAQLVAAKKAAASELSAQRKLKVSEYGRNPGKASKVAPDAPSLVSVNVEPQRCKFITAQSDPLYVAYHDQEWGIPVHDDRSLFELLVLAGAQVELTWTTILHQREVYRNVFCGYDPVEVASFNEKHIQSLEADKTLLLQSGKIRGVVENARRVLEVVQEFGSFDTYLWSFVNYKPMVNHYRYPKQLPVKTSKAEFISKDLVRRGFRFVGPTIVYSFMQAAGMTNDHLVQCFRHKACMLQMVSSQDEAEGGRPEDFTRAGCEVKKDSSMLCMDAPYADSELLLPELELRTVDDSERLLHELELKTYHLGQHFTHSEFVHIEAY